MGSKSRSNSNTANRLSVANATELASRVGTRDNELILQRDTGEFYTWGGASWGKMPVVPEVANELIRLDGIMDSNTAQITTNTANIGTNTSDINALQISQSAGTVGFTTKALMDADLAHDAGTIAIVTNDTTESNNGSYIKLLASGSGSWQKSSSDMWLLIEEDIDNRVAKLPLKTRNIIIDPFLTSEVADNGVAWLNRIRQKYFNIAVNPDSPYKGKSLLEDSGTNQYTDYTIYKDEMGIEDEEQITLSFAIKGTIGKRIYVNATYINASNYKMAQNVGMVGSFLFDGTDQVMSFSLTPMANTEIITFRIGHHSGTTGTYSIDAVWGEVGASTEEHPFIPYTPIDNNGVELGTERNKNYILEDISFYDYEYTSRTVSIEPESINAGTITNNISGWGVDLLPTGVSFNAIEIPNLIWNLDIDPSLQPKRLRAVVSTAPTGSDAKISADAVVLSMADIKLDFDAGKADANLVIPCRSPDTGELITITDAMMLDVYCVSFEVFDTDTGGTAYGINAPLGIMPNRATTNGRYANGATWLGANTYNNSLALRLVTLDGISEVKKLTMLQSMKAISDGDGGADLIALPHTLYGVVGREMSAYFDNMTIGRGGDEKGVDFTLDGVPTYVGSHQKERWSLVPTTTLNTPMLFESIRGETLLDSRQVQIVTAPISNAGGTKTLHFIGDSLTSKGTILTAINDIASEDVATDITLIGTLALSLPNPPLLHDGYSGQGVGALFAPTISGVGANPFYDGATFNYTTYMTNTAQATPDYVFIGYGVNDQTGISMDNGADTIGTGMVSNYEEIITSIHAYNANIKVCIVAPAPTGRETDGFATAEDSRGSGWRMNRNLKITAQKIIDAFNGREAEGIYILPASVGVDTTTGYQLGGYQPRNKSIEFITYSTYALLVADLSQESEQLAYATDVNAYFVKVGGSGIGTWRSATEQDGIIRRFTDTVHYGLKGGIQHAECAWAMIKCLG